MTISQPSTILELSPESEIAKGATRRCFLHPQNPNILIKIEKDEKSKSNIWEAKYYGEVAEKYGEVTGITKLFGFVDTNLGKGLMVEAVRNADGGLSRRIADIVENPDKVGHWSLEKVYAAVQELTDRLIAMDIRQFDLNMGNIVIREDEKGNYTACIIDLKGPYDNKEHIPLSSWFSFFAKRKMKRRSEKLLRSLQSFIEKA